MKIKVEKNSFLSALSLSSHFTSSKFSSLTSLSGVMLKTGKAQFELFSSDLSSYFHTKVRATVSGDGVFVFEPRKMAEFIALLPEGEMEIEADEKQIIIREGKSQGIFPLMKADDFPLPPKLSAGEQKLKTDLLARNLPLVLFAASLDETRPALSGVNFQTNEELIMVATDGFRLSLIKTEKAKEIPSCIIPASFLKEILKFLKEEKEVSFGFSEKEKAIMFRIGNQEFFSRLIDGEFPPYEKVVPQQKTTTIEVDREELLRNTKLVSVFARELSNIVVFEVKNKELVLRPKTDGNETNYTSVEADVVGNEQRVAFNHKFILELLNTIEEKKVTIEILRSDAPVVFKTSNKNFLHIVMPVRIQE